MPKINIAIDGPAGAGKSTVARLVAEKMGYIYVDTGAMYRAVTLKVIEAGLTDGNNPASIAALAHKLSLQLKLSPEGQRISVNGEDVTEYIRTLEVNRHVSMVARIEEVRSLLVLKQQQLASAKGVVMDGRDIGTHVLPEAEVKVFLTASARKRAERRFNEMDEDSMTLDELEADIERRDRMDAEREISPLKQAVDATLIDSTSLTIPQVVEYIIDLCQARFGKEIV
ncbi:cytidylate kinase [Paenibacillus swuensis]|uniref:Cytidylate kinase n=1 Tax=Paenibacillus swuensis TaxID=1178515 RepID=A0A172TPP2_9BACL|nr:(d)CMP kinase [Paenibacillus swuensis]ANE49025.1 cytidylate kinase [Paenibacillus swuensis]